jgi:hypothetical protein
MLIPFADELWTDTRSAKFLGVETGSRMTVIRMKSGGLFVHSPVALDDTTRAQVDALGEVRAVVAPSLFHHLHVGAWMKQYPKAQYCACPGLEWKRPDLAFDRVLGDEPHREWADELGQVYLSSRRENEVVFYHRHSRTLVCADAMLNLSTHPLFSTRMVARFMGNDAPGTGWMEPLMVRDRPLARRQVDRMLEWDIDGVVLGHGAPLEHGGLAALRHAYAWL